MITIRVLLTAGITAVAAWAASPTSDRLPLFFMANQGQMPADIQFFAQASSLRAYFLSSEAVFTAPGASVRMHFDGANSRPALEGVGVLAGKANFLIGPANQWHTGIPLYQGVVYRQLYPGIDMSYGGNGRNLKSEFVVAPGADPAMIRVHYTGASRVSVDESGALVVEVDGRQLREEAPFAYQQTGDNRSVVAARFRVTADGEVGFTVGNFDRTLALVIDPVLAYSTLLGGSNSNTATAIAVEGSGAAYVTGVTASTDFPVVNAVRNWEGGSNDVFVAKLNAAGNGVAYCTYLGGVADDRAYGIAVDGNGEAYVTGSTKSVDFPVASPLQSKLSGAQNAFVLKLNAAGNGILFSTFLGGSGSDVAYGIALDASANAYITGDTTSSNFPATGFQTSLKGGQDGFVTKLSSDGSHVLYSSYLGGSSTDHAAALAVDGSGRAYVVGSTYSADFPVLNAYQPKNAGGQEAFLTSISPDGSALAFSTYFGGSGGTVGSPEAAQAVALDAAANVYVTGVTSSTNFPLLNPLQAALLGGGDAFVAKFTSTGTLAYSSFLGGTGQEIGTAILVDGSGNMYVSGYTYSVDLPVTSDAFQSANGGGYDAFLAKLNAAGSSILYLTYLGGNGSDAAAGMAMDPSGNIYLAGWTLSTNFPLLNPYQSINVGNYDAFVTKFSFAQLPTIVGVSPNSGSGASQVFALQVSNAGGASGLSSVAILVNTGVAMASSCQVTYNQAQKTLTLLTDAGLPPSGSITPGSGSQQNSQCTLSGSGSSVSTSGTTLTVNLSLAFQSTFSGAKNVYVQAANASGATGWQQEGTWTIPAAAVLGVSSVAPASGSGAVQAFSFVFSDQQGAGDLTSVSMQLSTGSAANSCYARYDRAPNAFYLTDDTGSNWSGPLTPGSSSILQNSQCILSAAGSSAASSGTNLTVTIALTFKASFVGAKTIYAYAADATANTGWKTVGNWTVTAIANPLSVISITPSSGSGMTQTFSYVVADAYGTADLTSSWIQISTGAAANSCYARYDVGPNSLYLAADSGTSWLGPVTPGAAATLQNSQCTLNAAGSSFSVAGINLTVNVALTFKTTFTGAKTIYVYANNATVNTGWQTEGTWTVPSALSIVSLTPNTGAGLLQTFSVVVGDQYGAADLTMVWMEFSTAVAATANSCSIRYDPIANALYLLNDAGASWLGPVTPSSMGNLQNSQCTLNAQGSSFTASGTNLTVNISLTFKTAFGGAKSIYAYANNATANTGWQTEGAWTVPPPLSVISVTPNSGSKVTQTFHYTLSDSAGAYDLSMVWMEISSAVTATANSCYSLYLTASNTLYLLNDAGTAWLGPVTPGGSGTIQNSQCTLNAAASASLLSGDTVLVYVGLTFQPAYKGTKNIYVYGNSGNASTGWQTMGTWTLN